MFETHENVSKYNYLYTVSVYADYPEAILGIKNGYELEKVSGWVSKTNWQKSIGIIYQVSHLPNVTVNSSTSI